MNDKIFCPWCGAEMEINTKEFNRKHSARMECHNSECNARGPMTKWHDTEEKAIENARAVALLRHTLPILCETCDAFGWDEPQCRNTDGTKYGRKECKYWSSKPTDEERSATRWEK